MKHSIVIPLLLLKSGNTCMFDLEQIETINRGLLHLRQSIFLSKNRKKSVISL